MKGAFFIKMASFDKPRARRGLTVPRRGMRLYGDVDGNLNANLNFSRQEDLPEPSAETLYSQ